MLLMMLLLLLLLLLLMPLFESLDANRIMTRHWQIALFCVSTLAGGIMFYRWRRIDKEDRGRVWRLYGWYCGLMMCGSCFGAVAWAAWMNAIVNTFKGDVALNPYQITSSFALVWGWRAAFNVTYAIEFMCLSAAKLMVLDRMSMFAAPEGTGIRRRWVNAGRIVMAVVVLGNAVGLVANFVSASQYQKASEFASSSSAYYATNDTVNGRLFFARGRTEIQLGGSVTSVQLFSEVAVLLFIVAAFVAVGVLSLRRVSAWLLGVDASSAAASQGTALRLQVVGTTVFVFVAFLVRSVFSTMSAIAFQLRDVDRKCSGAGAKNLCDATCFNVYTHISMWVIYTPEFQLMIVLVSSPLALLVALWGMTSKATLHLMKSSRQDVKLLSKLTQWNKREKAAMPQIAARGLAVPHE